MGYIPIFTQVGTDLLPAVLSLRCREFKKVSVAEARCIVGMKKRRVLVWVETA